MLYVKLDSKPILNDQTIDVNQLHFKFSLTIQTKLQVSNSQSSAQTQQCNLQGRPHTMCRRQLIKHWCDTGKHEIEIDGPQYKIHEDCKYRTGRTCLWHEMTAMDDNNPWYVKYTCKKCRDKEMEARRLRDIERRRRDGDDDRGRPPPLAKEMGYRTEKVY